MAGVKLTRRAANKIADAVRFVEDEKSSSRGVTVPPGQLDFSYMFHGVADAAIAMNTSGTVSVYYRNDAGVLTDTGDDVTAYTALEDISAGQVVTVWTFPTSYEIIGWRCP